MRWQWQARSVAALAACLLSAVPCPAQTVELAQPRQGAGILEVTLSPAEITVGERVEARLTLVWTGPIPAHEPRFPPWSNSWGTAEVLSVGELETVIGPGARRVYRQALVMTAFSTGEVRLPEVRVTVPLAGDAIEIAHDRDIGFEVRSVLPEQRQELEPRPAAPPRPPPADLLFAWTVAGLAGLSLLAAWLLRPRLRVPTASAAPRPPAEPLPELLDHLQRLDPAAAEPAHTGLSLALRNFLGRGLGFNAAESTTTEIQRHLRTAPLEPAVAGHGAPTPLRRDVVGLLRACDQVKFAQAPVPAPVTRGHLREARDLGYKIDRCLKPPGEVAADEVAVDDLPEAAAR